MKKNQYLLKYNPWTEAINQILLKRRVYCESLYSIPSIFITQMSLLFQIKISRTSEHICSRKRYEEIGNPAYILFEEKNNQKKFHCVKGRL